MRQDGRNVVSVRAPARRLRRGPGSGRGSLPGLSVLTRTAEMSTHRREKPGPIKHISSAEYARLGQSETQRHHQVLVSVRLDGPAAHLPALTPTQLAQVIQIASAVPPYAQEHWQKLAVIATDISALPLKALSVEQRVARDMLIAFDIPVGLRFLQTKPLDRQTREDRIIARHIAIEKKISAT